MCNLFMSFQSSTLFYLLPARDTHKACGNASIECHESFVPIAVDSIVTDSPVPKDWNDIKRLHITISAAI